MKINPIELKQIIKEEATRLKKRMMLESEKASILKQLQEIDSLDEDMQEEGKGIDFLKQTFGSGKEDPNSPAAKAASLSFDKVNADIMSKRGPDYSARKADYLKQAATTAYVGQFMAKKSSKGVLFPQWVGDTIMPTTGLGISPGATGANQ